MANFFPLQPSNNVEVSDGTDTLAVNTDGSLNINSFSIPATVTLKKAQVTGTGANQTIATVTAGKTAYIIGIQMGSGLASQLNLKTNADVEFARFFTVANDSKIFHMGGFPIASYAAAENIRGLMTNGVLYTVFYYEL